MNENRDLDLFFGMLQERARAIKARVRSDVNIDFELFRNLPRDVTINILSRLSIGRIMRCKLVCKAWRDLIESREFGNYLQSDRNRCLIVFPYLSYLSDPTMPPKIKESNVFPYPSDPTMPPKIEQLNNTPMPLFHIGLSESVPLARNSVNGLILLLRREQHRPLSLWVCNPITREYVRIPNPSDIDFHLGLPHPPQHRRGIIPMETCSREYGNYNFGFGVSRISKQYKVVWISQSECRVYTLGTTGGRWKSIAVSGKSLRYNKWNTECAFVGGNLYWLDPPESQTQTEITCFDLETEGFTYFSAPPTLQDDCYRSMCVLDECLCLCDVYCDGIDIWLMRGREWSKKVGMDEHRQMGSAYGYLVPIKDDGNGMLLGGRCNESIFRYFNNRIKLLYPIMLLVCAHEYPRAVAYTPSFLPLTTQLLLVHEDVSSF